MTALDALIGGGGGTGNTSVWAGGISPMTPVTDQSQHYTGAGSATGANAQAPVAAKAVMYISAGIVVGAIVLLWLLGGISLRSALR